jgi:hypothetical protein
MQGRQMSDQQKEVDQNFAFFQGELPKLLPAHRGRFALIRHKKIEGIYDTIVDAVSAGNKLYMDSIFSVQPITDAAIDLGFYSHAGFVGTAQRLPGIHPSRDN